MDDINNPQAGADDPTNATGDDNNNTTNNNTDEPPGNTQDAPDAPTLNTNTTNPTGADELLNRIEQARTTNNITAIVQAINGVDISTLPINENTLIASVETYRKSTEDERNRMDKPSLLQLLEAQARVSRMTLPNNVNNESRAVIRNRIDDSIRQLALTEILSQSVQTNTTNTQNVQRQRPQTGVTTHNAAATEEQLNKLVKRQSSTQNTKHIDVRYHYIRERLRDGAFELHKIHTSDNPADLLTKVLLRAVRRHHHDVILGNRWPAVAFTANRDN